MKYKALILGTAAACGIFSASCFAALYGDADADGNITASDAAVVLQKVLNGSYTMPIEKTEEDYIKTVDVDNDKTLSAADSAEILQKTLISTYQMPCERNDIPKQEEKNFIPQELETIPSEYFSVADTQGTLVELYYNTYESMTYEQKEQVLTKRAIVYLPYGYNENEKYNIFYLMHGGWGNETTTLGTPERPNGLKNVIDHAIADGKMQKMIIVCPTYNNTSPEDSASFSLALTLNRNYHNELLNDLMPAAESKYSTYAEDTTPEAFEVSREHRGFGGFSMGSVATWRTFQNCIDYFYYFMPMSCGTSLDDNAIFLAAEKRSDFFMWIMTGTEDFAYSYDTSRVNKMRNLAYFKEADNEDDGNFAYRVKEGYDHGGMASSEYTYNGLKWFWK